MIHLDRQFLDKNTNLYLAFSGGVDSLAAADFLSMQGYRVILVHVNHLGNEGDNLIQAKASDAASRLGLRLEIFRGNASNTGDGIEAACRTTRYEIFSSNFHRIVICHHLNDLAEGYFQNCLKGTPERTPLRANTVYGDCIITRPFLRTKKVNFEDWVERRGLSSYIAEEYLPSQRQSFRDKVFPLVGQDFTAPARKLFVDTGRIYE